ncbi:glutamine amidotransferase [Streptococcus sanguinis]|uniref:type 1 glutamine amidotransferase family protein n=1 Tax=Streptococcus sanguinis TaxID=1305 RepID=UPI001CBEF6FE|nr:type 1 glutamine amidotransferase family protein [Streptococcus sanguinis]MBZ2037719.1 glutamine amidotransferase [Streptococcus sanguinis]MBZ2067617.1 glutamine amidotransferase [Streptococcus sanguinis]MBZ2070267.1 glutamine amidotransferase [Streptococcus sanguinis]
MKTALILLLNDYADWEVAYISSTINMSEEWSVKTISTQKEVKSIGGLTTKIDYLLEEIPSQYDLLILIGGNSWTNDDSDIINLVNHTLTNNIILGAICGSVDFMARNGLLNNFKHTGNDLSLWNTFDQYSNKDEFQFKQAVRDKNLVTANGTAPIEFEQLILESIDYAEKNEIEKTIYLHRYGFYDYSKKYGNPFA